MPLSPSNVQVKMTAGLDEKSDPKSLQNKMTVLQNTSFQSPGQYQKRDGFAPLTPLSAGVSLSTFQNELLSGDGTNLYSYSPEDNAQISKGAFVPISLETESIARLVYTVGICDQSYDPVTGLKCFIYTYATATNQNWGVYYSVIDTKTGSTLVYNQPISSTSKGGKVGIVGANFVIVYLEAITGHVNYRSISTATPTVISSPTLISSIGQFTGLDILEANGNLYICYSTGIGASIVYLNSGLTLSSIQVVPSTFQAFMISLESDGSGNIWIARCTTNQTSVFYNVVTVFNSTLTSIVLATTSFDSSAIIQNVTLNVQGTVATIYAEIFFPSSSSSSQNHSNFIKVYELTISGSLTAGVVFVRGLGLASKCFNYNGQNFMLGVYNGSYQPIASTNPALSGVISYYPVSGEPTYFLINSLGNIVMKLAPGLAPGYYNSVSISPNSSQMEAEVFVLPEVVQISSGVYSIGYLIEENAVPVSGIVTSQNGGMSVTFNFNPTIPAPKIQLGNNLLLGSGQLWAYDGQNITEQGFHIFPENVSLGAIVQNNTGGIGIGASAAVVNQVQYSALYEWVDAQGQINRSAPSIPLTVNLPANNTLTPVTFTGSTVAGSNVITGGYVVTGEILGAVISSTSTPTLFPAGTYITGFTVGASISVSQPATATASGQSFETFDISTITINIPTLRQTAKQNVSLVLYRTENNGTIFYRVTAVNLNAPNYNKLTINDPTVDYLTITDTLPDAEIIGNEQLYTTGGTVENINAPAVSAVAKFKNRVVYLSPENPFQWGYSQQDINGVPVEFNSELFVENIDQGIGQALAVSPLDDKLILFGPTSKYYVVGQGPTPAGTNNDFSEATKVPGISGCSNPNAVMEIPTGLIYQDAVKGIYHLDHSLTESYIGADVESFNGQTVTSVQKFETQNKVIFTLI